MLAVGLPGHPGVRGRIDEDLRAQEVRVVARGHRREVAARAVAAHDHPRRVGRQLLGPRPRRPHDGGARVLQGRGVRMLGREAVVHRQAHVPGGVGDLARDPVEAVEIADAPAAAVEPDDGPGGVRRDGGPVRAGGDAPVVLGPGEHHVLHPGDLLDGAAELERRLQVGRALGLQPVGARRRRRALDDRADLRMQLGQCAASASAEAPIAASMRWAMARPVKPTSACSRAGLPWVT